VDIFLHDAQLLPWLSPRLNDAVAALAADYAEESASLKLTFAEGEVDFVVAPTLLALAAVPLPFAGRVVLTEPSAEIVAKKAFYRGASLKIRDVVDLALVLRREPESGPLLAPILRSVRPVLERRLALLAPTFAERLRTEVHLLPAGETEAAGSLEALRSFLGGLGSP
jgi:hypothetical protein